MDSKDLKDFMELKIDAFAKAYRLYETGYKNNWIIEREGKHYCLSDKSIPRQYRPVVIFDQHCCIGVDVNGFSGEKEIIDLNKEWKSFELNEE